MQQIQQLWVVWACLILSLFIYGAMPFLLPPPPTPPPELQVVFVGALAFVGLLTATATIFLRRFALLRPAQTGTLNIDTQAGFARFFTISMLVWVLSESIGIYGLVLFFLYRVLGPLYSFLAVAVLLLVFHAPRTDSLRLKPSSADLARPDIKIG
jgi:hypothetical protein